MKYLLMMMLLATSALADESCETPCPEGKEQVTFSDGNNARCNCVDPSTGMQDGPAGCTEGENCEDNYVHEEE